MNCDESRRLLDAYHDRELDVVRSVEIERHLSDCGKCTAALQNLRALRKAMAPARDLPCSKAGARGP